MPPDDYHERQPLMSLGCNSIDQKGQTGLPVNYDVAKQHMDKDKNNTVQIADESNYMGAGYVFNGPKGTYRVLYVGDGDLKIDEEVDWHSAICRAHSWAVRLYA